MSGPIVLALRILMALALYGFLGWAMFILWTDVRREGAALAQRRVPGISLAFNSEQGTALLKHFSNPVITLGRDPGCDFPLFDDRASTRHAQLTYHHKQWWVADLGSTNGTFLNGTLVEMPTVLTSGDEIKCGTSRFSVDLSGEAIGSPIKPAGDSYE